MTPLLPDFAVWGANIQFGRSEGADLRAKRINAPAHPGATVEGTNRLIGTHRSLASGSPIIGATDELERSLLPLISNS
jgi:hypothetical protein